MKIPFFFFSSVGGGGGGGGHKLRGHFLNHALLPVIELNQHPPLDLQCYIIVLKNNKNNIAIVL